MVKLLRTKLFVPHPRKNLVSRPRLVNLLNAGLDKKLTLITAPAGFGKTTLLSEWIPQCPRCVTWLSLEESDNDPVQFWTYFIASLQELNTDLGFKAYTLLQSPQVPPIKTILTELINDLIIFSDPLASVLDDYHFIESQAIHEALTFLIDHLPANVHLLITTRDYPPLPLARLRARDHLNEIRAGDLRFTQEETGAFLIDVMGLELSRQEVAVLEDHTEGWVVGLQLAGLSMQRGANPKAFIADFSGSHRHILDYLTDEVLQRQPEDIRTFLLQTAILDRLYGPLCDALTGQSDGDRLLAHLEAANLFVIPLDMERRWYRYHHLFAELLHSQLIRSHPDWIPELHLRASCWYEENGDIHAAVEHALQASDLTRAAYLIERYTMPKLYQGEVTRVLGWFDRLPESILDSAPMLCIGKAWALVLMQRGTRRPGVELALKSAELALDNAEADEALRGLVNGYAASIKAYLHLTPGEMEEEPENVIALARQAQRLLPAEEKAIRSVTYLSMGYGYLAMADVEAARQAYEHTLECGIAGKNYYAAIYGPSFLVLVALVLGQLREAQQICDRNIERFNQILAGQSFPPIGALYALRGSILLEMNHLAEAEQAMSEGLDLIRWTGESVAHRKGYPALARLRAFQGDRPGMLEAVKALEEAFPDTTLHARALYHCLSMRQWPGDPEVQKDAQGWLAQSGIEFADLRIIKSVDTTSIAFFECNLNAAHVLAYLAREDPGAYQLEDVHAYLEHQQEFAETKGFAGWVTAVAIARTLLYQAAGQKQAALESLEAALRAAVPTGLLRIFVDEFEYLQAPLEKLKPRLTDADLIAYADHLLEVMVSEHSQAEIDQKREAPLSKRELEVLDNLAQGLTYEEIGQQLFLSLNTIQFHVKNIYGKLLVNKRVQAVEKARELNLI